MAEGDKPLPVFLTAVEVANMLRMSPRTLEGLRLAGKGPPFIRIGKTGRSKLLYKLQDVEAWVESHRG